MSRRFTLILATLAMVGWPALTQAELQVETQSSDQGELTVYKMTVTPAAEPVPALRHRLVLREIDQKVGNAATMYYRAFQASEEVLKRLRNAQGRSYDEVWSSATLPNDKLKQASDLILSSDVMTHLREAVVREGCDWGYDLRSIRGPELFSFLLPEAAEERQLCRSLLLMTRVAIYERRYDDALELLRINLKLGRDVGREPLLICGLIGDSIIVNGNKKMIELIAAPGSPNLFWALAQLPSPLIDLRPAVRFELSSVFRVFPVLMDAETQEHSPEEWSRLLAEGLQELGPLTGGGPSFSNETMTRIGFAGLGIATYGPAKQRLIAGGMDAARVEQMPVGQVLAIDAARQFRLVSDEFEKWWYVPYATSREHGDDGEDLLGGNKLSGGYGRLLASLLLPAVNAARTAQERHQWQIDGLRTVEAVRMHAAKTGKLPKSLDEVAVVPVPVNRVTGKPYQYRLDGDTGVVELPFSDGFPSIAWRFEIKLAN